MKTASLLDSITPNETKPAISILFESENTKEIRIVFKKGQIMKAHKTPFPIVVEIFKGKIDFGVNNEIMCLKEGSLISLKGDVIHDLTALEDSIVRLSLSLKDKLERVKNVATSNV